MIGRNAAGDPVSGILDVESRRDAGPDFIDRPAQILIVEDELHSRQVLESMLRPEGFLLQSAGGGEEALAMLARAPPDLILLDVLMEGMDGHQVAAAIKANPATKNIPIISPPWTMRRPGCSGSPPAPRTSKASRWIAPSCARG